MGNPYTSVSVGAAYNASPPADDASQVDSNQLAWSKHKTKLSDPLKTALESINSNNATAHGLHLGQTFETKTAPYTIQAPGDRGKFFEVTGTTTITLPAAVDAGDGFPVGIVNNGSATVTVDGNASELINGSTSITLAANEALVITCDGSSWVGLEIRAAATSPITRIAGSSGAAGADITWQNLTTTATKNNNTLSAIITTTGVGVGTWKFKYTIIYQSALATVGVQFGINHSGTVGEFAVRWTHITTGTTAITGIGDNQNASSVGTNLVEGSADDTINVIIGANATAGVDVADTDVMAIVEGIIVVTATGQLELLFANETGATVVSAMADSCLELMKIE